MMMDVDPSEEELLSAYTKALREFESASSELKKATNEAINTTKTRKSSPDNPHAKLAAANAQIAKQKATETTTRKRRRPMRRPKRWTRETWGARRFCRRRQRRKADCR